MRQHTITPFDLALGFVLHSEGGQANDPADPGGLTRYGISARAHPTVDIARLTRDEAAQIYRVRYWQAAGCERLPNSYAVALFDGAVNHGVKRATRLMQKALGVAADGINGPRTQAAARRADPRLALTAYLAHRARLYCRLGRHTDHRFTLGWQRRLMDLAWLLAQMEDHHA